MKLSSADLVGSVKVEEQNSALENLKKTKLITVQFSN